MISSAFEVLQFSSSSRGLMNTSSITRREFIKREGTAALGFGLAGISGCAKMGQSGAFWAGEQNSIPSAGDWDPIFDPPIQWFSRYGGAEALTLGRAVAGLNPYPKGVPWGSSSRQCLSITS
jgi:hypothetical protein